MKQVLFILTALFILGCSSDDSKSDIDTNKQLKKITSYSLTDGKEEFTGETFFENGREIGSRYLYFDGEIIESRNHYNHSGLLVREEKRESSQDEFETSATYKYDSKNRLIEVTRFSFDSKRTLNIIYNSDNTIIGETIFRQKATYFLNELGLIDKQITESNNSNLTTIATYENNFIKIVKSVNSDDPSLDTEFSFEYGLSNNQKTLNIKQNKFGTPNNRIVYTGLIQSSLYQRNTNFSTKSTLNGEVALVTIFTFDSNDYVVKSDSYSVDGEKVGFSIYEYN